MSKITSFIIGGLIGAGVALMYAPNAGEKNRALVTEKANALVGEAKDFGAGLPGSAKDALDTVREKGAELLKGVTSKGQDFAKDATAKGSSFVDGATSRVKEVTGQAAPAEDSEELREKIEAARRRIAAQVMENAEQSKALTADAIVEATDAVTEEAAPAAKDAVEEAVEAAGAAAEEAADKAAAAVEDAAK